MQTTNFITLNDILVSKLHNSPFNLSKEMQEQITTYLLLLAKWNKAYNLTSVRDPKEMITRHILDSLVITPYVHGDFILDVGSGAGLPGIPLAITQPERKFVLLDSNGKKTRFLIHVISILKLANVSVVQARVEEFMTPHCFTTIVARAFSSLNEFLQKTQHLCCDDGLFLAMKGNYPIAELAEIDNQFMIEKIQPLDVSGLNAERHLVIAKKVNN